MGGMQRRKGAVGERELVQELNNRGLLCRRTAQYCGKAGTAADVVCEGLGDVKTADRLKGILLAHAAFIDKAAAEANKEAA